MSITTDPIELESDLIQAKSLTLFITPQLPPVVKMGQRDGELVLEIGEVYVDGILESDLGVWNTTLTAGGTLRALITATEDGIQVSTTTERLEVDVLITPAQWEIEPTRQLLESVIAKSILPKYMDILKELPIPNADLSSLQLPNIQSLRIKSLNFKSDQTSLSAQAEISME